MRENEAGNVDGTFEKVGPMSVVDLLLVDQLPEKRHVRSTLRRQRPINQVRFVELEKNQLLLFVLCFVVKCPLWLPSFIFFNVISSVADILSSFFLT